VIKAKNIGVSEDDSVLYINTVTGKRAAAVDTGGFYEVVKLPEGKQLDNYPDKWILATNMDYETANNMAKNYVNN